MNEHIVKLGMSCTRIRKGLNHFECRVLISIWTDTQTYHRPEYGKKYPQRFHGWYAPVFGRDA